MTIRWAHVSVIAMLYSVMGLVGWIIHILSDRARWCSIPVAVAKASGSAPAPAQDCTVTLGKVIDKLGDLGMVMVGAVMLGLLMYAAVQLGIWFKFTGPLGWGGEVHRDGDDAK